MRKIYPLISLFLLAGCVSESRDGDSLIEVGDHIPSFSVATPDGESVSSSDFGNKGGLIVLFASYCDSCREELPEIEKVWRASGGGADFIVAPLSRQSGSESPEKVAALWADAGYTMPSYLDTDGEVYRQFASQWIPRIYVVDKEMKVTFMTVGDSDVGADVIVAELRKALGININL